MMPTTGAEGRRWSDLPDLFLDLVARHLSLVDHMRFGLVCKPWRSVATTAPPCPQPPWLLSSSRDRRELLCYSFWEDRTIRFRLPLGMIGWECLTASHGWLFMAAPRGPELCLLNPVTRARIDLPPRLHSSTIWDVALSSDPDTATATATGDRAVVVLHGIFHTLTCRVGDEHWSILRDSPRFRSTPLAFHKGLLHMMEDNHNLVALDLDYNKSRIVPTWFDDEWVNWICYLVEGGQEGANLMGVFVGLNRCIVLQLVGGKDGSSQQWVGMNNLGGAALFVSKGHSEIVSADACVTMGMKGDCVYELDQSFVLWEMPVGDGSKPAAIHYLRQMSNMLYFCLWFSPSIPSPLNGRRVG